MPDGGHTERRLDGPPMGLVHEQPQSAPGEVGPPRTRVALPVMKHSLDQQLLRHPPSLPPSHTGGQFELDPTAPIRAMRSPSTHSSDVQGGSGGSKQKQSSLLQAVVEEEEKGDNEGPSGGKGGEDGEREDVWGESFRIEWLCTEKLPFHRARHLRNPWNHDREVKVSRDGTELEPTVGRRLLEEWIQLSELQPALSRRGGKPASSVGLETPKERGAEGED